MCVVVLLEFLTGVDHPALQDLPLEYNTWLLFRQPVDIILLKYSSL